jgi:hypothetical protein
VPIEGGDIVWTIRGDTKDVDAAMSGVSKDAANLSGSLTKHTKAIGVAFTAMGAAIVGGLGVALKSFVDTGSALNDMSQRTGVSVKALSGLKFAAEQTGTSIDTIEGAIRRMQKGIQGGFEGFIEKQDEYNKAVKVSEERLKELNEALNKTYPGGKYDKILADINEEQAKLNELMEVGADQDGFVQAIQNIGLEFENLRAMNPERQFETIARALAQVVDPTERAGLAMELFGKSGAELLPLIGDMDALVAKAKELGIVWSEEMTQKADLFGDKMGELKGSLQGLLFQVGPIIVDALIPFVQQLTDAAVAAGNWARENPVLFAGLIHFGGAIGALMAVLGPLIIAMPGLVATFGLFGRNVGAVGTAAGTASGGIRLLSRSLGTAGLAGALVYAGIEIKNLFGAMAEMRSANQATDTTSRNTIWQINMLEQSVRVYGIAIDEAAIREMSWGEKRTYFEGLLKGHIEAQDAATKATDGQSTATDSAATSTATLAGELGTGTKALGEMETGLTSAEVDMMAAEIQSYKTSGAVGDLGSSAYGSAGGLNQMADAAWSAYNAMVQLNTVSGGVPSGYAAGGVIQGFADGGVIPHFAMGGVAPAIVGEQGPELAFMPVGTRILSHGDAMEAARGGANTTINMGGTSVMIGPNDTRSPEQVWRQDLEPIAFRRFSDELHRARRSI